MMTMMFLLVERKTEAGASCVWWSSLTWHGVHEEFLQSCLRSFICSASTVFQ